MSGWWRRKPKDDAPSRAGAAETKANDGHEAGWLPTIGSRAAEAVRTALEQLTQCLHDDEDGGEVPRHVISKLLRAVSVEEFVGERGFTLSR